MSDSRFARFLPPEEYEKLRAKYPKFNEPWGADETEELKKMNADAQPLGAMSDQLGRTPNSIRMKLKALGLWVPRPAPRPWTEEDDSTLIEGYESGATFDELAEHFGRTVRAIVARLVHLRVSLFNGG